MSKMKQKGLVLTSVGLCLTTIGIVLHRSSSGLSYVVMIIAIAILILGLIVSIKENVKKK